MGSTFIVIKRQSKLTLSGNQYIWLSMKTVDRVQTENKIRDLFSAFQQYVAEKNIPGCKKFIANYIDKVVVFYDRVEITLKIAIDADSGGDHMERFTSQKKPKRTTRTKK